MQEIILLTDYKNVFGSKWKSSPYRSGYDQQLLQKYFHKYGYKIRFLPLAEVELSPESWKGKTVLYTSSEETGLQYKGFVEDVILGLTNYGAKVIPDYNLLRANNNKVFMEMLRKDYFLDEVSGITSQVFGTFEEFENALANDKIKIPCVVKQFGGTMSRGVSLAKNKDDLIKMVKEVSRSKNIKKEIREILRYRKHTGYRKESRYENKFIIQSFVPGLKNDWKILIYGDQYYILKRNIKENDFRASGSGLNYQTGSEAEFPVHMLDFVKDIFDKLNTPQLSLDFGYDGKRGYVFEFQAIYFGTSTQYKSKDYYTLENYQWVVKPKEFDQEEAYVWSIVSYLDKK